MGRQRWLQIIPVATVMYILAFVNRANVSQALPLIVKDFHINPMQAGTAAGIFYWGYALTEVPGGYLGSRWSAKWLISILLVMSGGCAVGCGLVETWRGLWIMRLLLGVTEGGMYPAALVLISNWFPRKERARACACFSVAVPLSLILSAPLSGWLLDQWNWRVMLVVEGAFPFLWLLVWMARIHDYPRGAPWISSEEREYLEAEFRKDLNERESVNREVFFRALFAPQVLLLTLIKLLMLSGQLGYLFWLPSVLENAKRISHFEVGLLYAVPFVVGAIALVLISAHSDKTHERRGHVAAAMAIGGFALFGGALATEHSPRLAYLLVCLASVGAFAPLGPFWAISTEVFSRKMAGSVLGLISGIGGMGGYFGPLLVGYIDKKTGSFAYGFGLLAAFMLIGAGFCFGLAHRPFLPSVGEAAAEAE